MFLKKSDELFFDYVRGIFGYGTEKKKQVDC